MLQPQLWRTAAGLAAKASNPASHTAAAAEASKYAQHLQAPILTYGLPLLATCAQHLRGVVKEGQTTLATQEYAAAHNTQTNAAAKNAGTDSGSREGEPKPVSITEPSAAIRVVGRWGCDTISTPPVIALPAASPATPPSSSRPICRWSASRGTANNLQSDDPLENTPKDAVSSSSRNINWHAAEGSVSRSSSQSVAYNPATIQPGSSSSSSGHARNIDPLDMSAALSFGHSSPQQPAPVRVPYNIFAPYIPAPTSPNTPTPLSTPATTLTSHPMVAVHASDTDTSLAAAVGSATVVPTLASADALVSDWIPHVTKPLRSAFMSHLAAFADALERASMPQQGAENVLSPATSAASAQNMPPAAHTPAAAADGAANLPNAGTPRPSQLGASNHMYAEHDGMTSSMYLELRDYHGDVVLDAEGLRKEVLYQGLKSKSQTAPATQHTSLPAHNPTAAADSCANALIDSNFPTGQPGLSGHQYAEHDGITPNMYLALRDFQDGVLSDAEGLRQEQLYHELKLKIQAAPAVQPISPAGQLRSSTPPYTEHDGITSAMKLKLVDFQGDVLSDMEHLRQELFYTGLKLKSQAARLGEQGAALDKQSGRMEAQESQLSEQQTWLEFQGSRLAEQGRRIEAQEALQEHKGAQLGEQDELLGELQGQIGQLQGQIAQQVANSQAAKHKQVGDVHAWFRELGLEGIEGVSGVTQPQAEKQQIDGVGTATSVPPPGDAPGLGNLSGTRFPSAQIRRQQQRVLQQWRDRRESARSHRMLRDQHVQEEGVQAWLRQREELMEASLQQEALHKQALHEKFSQLPPLELSPPQQQAASPTVSSQPNITTPNVTINQTGTAPHVRPEANQQPPPPQQQPPVQRTPKLPPPFFGWGAGLGKGYARPLFDSGRRVSERILYSPWFSKTVDGRSAVQDLAAARQSAAIRLAESRKHDAKFADDFPLLPSMFAGAVAAMHMGLLGVVGLAWVLCIFLFASAALNRWNYEPGMLPPAPFPSVSSGESMGQAGAEETDQSAPVSERSTGSKSSAVGSTSDTSAAQSASSTAANRAAAANTAAATSAAAAAAAAEASDHLSAFLAADRRRLSRVVKSAPKSSVAPAGGAALDEQRVLAGAAAPTQQDVPVASLLSSHAAETGE